MRSVVFGLLLPVCGWSVQAAVQSRAVAYQIDGAEFTGHLYRGDAQSGKRPGVLVVREWWGLSDYAKKRARMQAFLDGLFR